ncbi:MAG: hypothetical protein GX460_06625, partial [Firmicutes bacterium]|nr:hypothetical protein [Bacillota bacterium]
MAAKRAGQSARGKRHSRPVRGRPRQAKSSPSSRNRTLDGRLGSEIGGIFLIAGAALGLISLARGPSGYVSGALADLMISAFGRGAYAVPIFMALTGILMLWRRTGRIV